MAEADAQETFTGTREVAAGDRFDEAALARWMGDHVEGFAGPLTVRQFKGGQSNPTYELTTPGGAYVLRRKPFGKLLPSAHAVDREYRLIAALHPTGFPVARPYALCEDEAVIGAVFYIMERVEGRILWDLALPGLTSAERGAIYDAQITTLAQLHSFDPEAIGLGDYGRPGNYFARQVDRWTRQYRASEGEPIDAMDRLIAWLPQTTPPDNRTGVVHGDYRLDNMVLHPSQPQVRAVLDWELSTLGNPLADFSYYLMQWVMPASAGRGLGGLDLGGAGHPCSGAGGGALLRPDRPRRPAAAGLVLRLQPVPPGRHHRRHRRARARRHRRQPPGRRHGRSHPHAGAGRLELRRARGRLSRRPGRGAGRWPRTPPRSPPRPGRRGGAGRRRGRRP